MVRPSIYGRQNEPQGGPEIREVRVKGWQGVAERRQWTCTLMKRKKGELIDAVWRVRDSAHSCVTGKRRKGTPVKIGAPNTEYLGW
jgi:hypothetical protein